MGRAKSLVAHGLLMGPEARKSVFGGLQKAKAQTSLRIRAV